MRRQAGIYKNRKKIHVKEKINECNEGQEISKWIFKQFTKI